jgi:Na+-transporting methylmalonyl-CoA/oxaloacetate decarboxylase beta subunit
MLPIANERKTAMKKLMVATGCAAMAAIVGCSDAQEIAESYGIIGGKDGPTAIWVTTRLPWSKDCPQEK